MARLCAADVDRLSRDLVLTVRAGLFHPARTRGPASRSTTIGGRPISFHEAGTTRKGPAAEKSVGLGCHIASYPELVEPARRVFRRVIESEDQESAPLAALGLAGLETQRAEEAYSESADDVAIRSALQYAIDSGHPDHAAVAAKWLAFDTRRTGNVDDARLALRAGMDSGNLEFACSAAAYAGTTFMQKGLTEDAIAVQRFIFDSGQPGAVVAAQNLACLLAEQGDTEGARVAYEYVLENSPHSFVVDEARAALDQL